ncbi:MAG TPA: hypothetical protein VLV87_04685 [Gammaproteobacteria bacterium]|nr:hypothetical protein [Gammaproteobacteria bacterium]
METPNDEHYQRLETLADNRQAAVAVAAAAARELALFSRDLEPLLYDKDEFVRVVQALATRSRMSRVRIVCIDPGASVRAGHRLIAVAQRFSSYVEVRRAAKDHSQLAETFLVADEEAVLFRPIASRYEGYSDLHAPLEARKFLKQFAEIWEIAEPDPEFRRLGI